MQCSPVRIPNLGIVDPVLKKMASCATKKKKGTRHACEKLHRTVTSLSKKLDVKISHVPVWIRYTRKRLSQVLVDYPVLRMTDWIDTIFKGGGHFFLGGRTLADLPLVREELVHFWENFEKVDSEFPFFKDMPKEKWGSCIPLALHGDEGRGRLHNPVMVVAVQPLLPIHGKKTNMQGLLEYVQYFSSLITQFFEGLWDLAGQQKYVVANLISVQ